MPLDHAQPGGPRIDIAYARFPARVTSLGTIVFLAGGPGEAAVRDARAIVARTLGSVRDSYDVLVLDQRGTGRSAPLRCAAAPDGRFPTRLGPSELRRAIARCGEQLGDARGLFTTYETALDLEDVRVALGLDRIIPFGVSYGGQVAGEYARRFPGNVQALVLDSTSPVEWIDTMSKLPQLALARVFREVCYPPGCDEILGQPVTLMAEASERLAERPLRGVDGADVHSLVMASDQDPLLRAELPAALQAAIERDAGPLRRLARYASSGSRSSGSNEVRFFATACVEGNQPWDPASDPAEREALLERHLADTAADYAPFPVDPIAEQLAATQCLGWPATPRPPLPPNIGNGPDVRVLLLAGREDLRTPLENQRRAADQFPRAEVLPVPGVGHSVLVSDASGCARKGLRQFLLGAAPGRCERGDREITVALPVFQSLGEVPRARGGLPARVERTATAVDLTLRDADRWLESGVRIVRGLRGGRVTLGRRGVVKLSRYEVVPGVRVSGTIRRRGTLTITGSGATGTLTFRPSGRMRGTLDGVTVRYRPLAIIG